jgi:hypothetical protein
MEREKLVDNWSVFRIWEFGANYSNFIYVTCICVKNFKLQLGHKFG